MDILNNKYVRLQTDFPNINKNISVIQDYLNYPTIGLVKHLGFPYIDIGETLFYLKKFESVGYDTVAISEKLSNYITIFINFYNQKKISAIFTLFFNHMTERLEITLDDFFNYNFNDKGYVQDLPEFYDEIFESRSNLDFFTKGTHHIDHYDEIFNTESVSRLESFDKKLSSNLKYIQMQYIKNGIPFPLNPVYPEDQWWFNIG